MDLHDVTPAPDFEDSDKFEQYITDRRVTGVSLALYLLC